LISILDLWFLIIGYAVMVAFFIIQRLLRRTKSAKSFKGGAFDKGNMFLIGSAVGVALWLPIILDLLSVAIFYIDLTEGLIALGVMLFGLGLRIWAAITLGKYYTTTLMMTENQKVVAMGPYAKIRHPGYLGEILVWTAFGILMSNLILVFLFPIMFVAVFLYRISSEERMLAKELGEDYVQYQRKTRKLVPYLY
jgi:protein-S-isoprenylcysteine O-methyltransferase Ste14